MSFKIFDFLNLTNKVEQRKYKFLFVTKVVQSGLDNTTYTIMKIIDKEVGIKLNSYADDQ